jgi:hypothetical protein
VQLLLILPRQWLRAVEWRRIGHLLPPDVGQKQVFLPIQVAQVGREKQGLAIQVFHVYDDVPHDPFIFAKAQVGDSPGLSIRAFHAVASQFGQARQHCWVSSISSAKESLSSSGGSAPIGKFLRNTIMNPRLLTPDEKHGKQNPSRMPQASCLASVKMI